MGGGFLPGGNASTSAVVIRTVEPLSDESSEQRFLGGMGGISRAPATAAEPPEKREKCRSEMLVLCHSIVTKCHMNTKCFVKTNNSDNNLRRNKTMTKQR